MSSSPFFPVRCSTFTSPQSAKIQLQWSDDYNVYREDRISDNHGGGDFQGLKNDIFVTHRDDLDMDCKLFGPNARSKARDQNL